MSKIRFLCRFTEIVVSLFANFHKEILVDDFDDNLFFYCKLDEHVASSIFWKGYHSERELKTLALLLKEDSVLIDVGANKGEFTIFGAKRVPRGRVLSFEPTEVNSQILEKNVNKNKFDNVKIFRIGLSNKSKNIPIYEPYDKYLNGTKNEGAFSVFESKEVGKFLQNINVEIFDQIIKNEGLNKVSVIKIDVEGSELEVLEGMSETLRKFKPYIIIETNEKVLKSANHSSLEIITFLDNLGYKFKPAVDINHSYLIGEDVFNHRDLLCIAQ